MMSIISRLLDSITGQGTHSVAVPPMDGMLRPNSDLDTLPTFLAMQNVDSVVAVGDRYLFSAGNSVMACLLDGTKLHKVEAFDAPVTAIGTRADGMVAIGLDDGSVVLTDCHGANQRRNAIAGVGTGSAGALAFDSIGSLYACFGSRVYRASEWKRDLMDRGATGSIRRINTDDFANTEVAGGLSFPSGIAFDRNGIPLVSEAWKHRVVKIAGSEKLQPVLDDLPSYPGRISSAANGGYWLTAFAPRSQMVEFVLREAPFRRRMMREVDENYWMAPTLRSGRNCLEPLQGGAVRQLGIHKPWAPCLSYGLLILMDADCLPIKSLHSRADGSRHGITSCIEHEGRVLIACRGDGVLIQADCSDWGQR